MEIRRLNTEELQQASQVALEGFREGGEAYQRYVDPDHLWVEMCKDKLFLWGVFENAVLCAFIAMESDGQITVFAVRQAYWGMGLEDMLRREMEQYAVQMCGLRPDEVRMTERWKNAGAQPMAGGGIRTTGIRGSHTRMSSRPHSSRMQMRGMSSLIHRNGWMMRGGARRRWESSFSELSRRWSQSL